jgi:hypothetical protein
MLTKWRADLVQGLILKSTIHIFIKNLAYMGFILRFFLIAFIYILLKINKNIR